MATCKIHITGQINGNHRLHSAIVTGEAVSTNGMFYSKYLTFPTKAKAYKALWEGYKSLRSDKEDAKNSMLRYSAKSTLRYDASVATILSDNN